jgi:very-short-patch-repair endonuclease
LNTPWGVEKLDLLATIEKTRRDLLELTARNRLIHTPLDGKRSSWIRVVGERSDTVFQRLARQGKALAFAAKEDDDEPLLGGDETGSGRADTAEANPANREPASGEEERRRFIDAFDADASESLDVLDGDASLDEHESVVDAGERVGVAKRRRDLFLQTVLTDEKLQSQLLRCFYDARTAEEEQGVSILYLACGFLKWRENGGAGAVRYAPLLLLPVELSRDSARSQFRLRFRDDEMVTNLSIQARLHQDFGIRLPDLPDSPIDEEDWQPSHYFDAIRQLVDNRDGWAVLDDEILLWFFSFTKFLMFRDLSPESWPAGSELTHNEMIQGLLGSHFSDDSTLPPICGDDEALDVVLSPADVVHVTDADSSQAVVIAEIAQGRNLVVQGPPGTGKSQTITNAIAAAVHAGKRVLFVSEKMAALEVVRRRLDNIGLGPLTLELHSHKARKREVLEELKATLDLGTPKGTQQVPVDELRSAAIRLRRHDAVLHEAVGASGMSPYQAMGRLLRLRSQGERGAQYQLPAVTDWTMDEFQLRREVAKDLDQLLKASGSPCSNEWYGVRCSPMLPADLARLQQRLEQVQPVVQRLREAAAELASQLGVPLPASAVEVEHTTLLAALVVRCPAGVDRAALIHPQWSTDVDRLSKAVTTAQALKQSEQELAGRVAEAAWGVDWSTTRIAIAAHGQSWLRIFNAAYRQAMAVLRGVCVGNVPKDFNSRLKLVDAIIATQRLRAELKRVAELADRLLGSVWRGTDTDFELAQSVIAWCAEANQHPFTQQHARTVAATATDTGSLQPSLDDTQQLLETADGQLAELTAWLKLDSATALGATEPRAGSLALWSRRISGWLDAPEQLSHYLATDVRVRKLQEGGLSELAHEVISGRLQPGEITPRLDAILAEAVLARAWAERPELGEFHGDSFDKLRERFAELDQQRIALSRLEVAKVHHDRLPLTSADSGQMSIVKREINKKRRHLPLRQLLAKAGQAIQRIKPVFMMSPLSVAQYLAPGAVEFDLLVIDEASQVQPVDALGAIARSKQIVVVGDQRQLPPTNFFGRISGDDVEDDEVEAVNASDLESILGLCEAQGLPSRMLRWHYRSRHESLIAVSNRRFYDSRLFIVPSPLAAAGALAGGSPLGLKLHHVADGWYDRGGSRVNRQEAIAVAQAVMEHAAQRPHLSLGVATFSSAQRDAIIDELELRRRANPAVEDFFRLDGAAPFFVKSLENVQGDERDVIFISVGYAKDQAGYFAQNFGPLNKKGGERRLNVLISRASSACEVFTSLKGDDIDLSRTQSEGVAALKLYLNYAEHGTLDIYHSHGDAESVFEEQVAQTLREHGLEVDHQIGVGGFFIDLAVRDPLRSGRYLLGIECDGAQYHAARWVRDRDRLRQQILESRGWIIHRIWSTDWFQRPEEELRKVLTALADAKHHWGEVDQGEADAVTNPYQTRNDVDEVREESMWMRVDDDYQPSALPGGQLYVEAAFKVREESGGPAELKPAKLARLVHKIVQVESPIHVDEVGRRCITLLGQGRLTTALKRKLSEAAQSLSSHGRVEQHGPFLHLPEQQTYPVRNRSQVESAGLRKVEFIAPEEVQAAILAVVRDHIGTNEAETVSSVAKLLGISNARSLQSAVRDLIDVLTANQALEDRSGKLFVG